MVSEAVELLLWQLRAVDAPAPVRTAWNKGIKHSDRRPCETCGTRFYASPGHIAQGWGRFCSMRCRPAGDKASNWRGGPIQCVCEACGKTFPMRRSHVAVGEGKFCSRACVKTTYPIKPSKPCEFCGKVTTKFASQDKNAHWYCSYKCRSDASRQKVERACVECGRGFLVKPNVIRPRATGQGKGGGSFCRMECKAKYMSKTTRTTGGALRNSHGGRRADLGNVFFRSTWEANYARYLNWLMARDGIKAWEFEPVTFEFPVKRGSKFYTPDFRVTENDGRVIFHEVKGYMDPRSATKLRRMALHHPTVPLIVIDKDAYFEIGKKLGALIGGWEADGLVIYASKGKRVAHWDAP